MLKTKCMPFYAEDNGSNLPFYLLQDKRGNDVIYINEKNLIYTNCKNTKINEQLNLYTKCVNQGICYNYKINDEVTILKQHKDANVFYFLNDGVDQLGIYQNKYDNLEETKIYFNEDFFCLTSTEFGDCIPEIVAGYDLNKKRLLDCSDYETSNSLYKSLVEIIRCRFDCICSILKGEILLDDENRLFYFLSFVLNKNITLDNYKENLYEVKKIILKRYPDLASIYISKDKNKIKEQSKNFNLGYFYFTRINSSMDNIKYLNNKTYSKLKKKS